MSTMHSCRAALAIGRLAISRPSRRTRPLLQLHNCQRCDYQHFQARQFMSLRTPDAQKDGSRKKEPGDDQQHVSEQEAEQLGDQPANPGHARGLAETQQGDDGRAYTSNEDLASIDSKSMFEQNGPSDSYQAEYFPRSPKDVERFEHEDPSRWRFQVTKDPPHDRHDLSIDGEPVDAAWIRNSCLCEDCRDKDSGQRLFATAHISEALDPSIVGPRGGSRVIYWKNELDGNGVPHQTKLPTQHLVKDARFTTYRHERSSLREPWAREHFATGHQWFDFYSFLNQKRDSMKSALEQLARFGLVFINNIPRSERAVEDIAERLGGLRKTFYGSTWDVRSVPAATNIAYTHGYLGPHTDLMYMVDPPKLQILHSLQADAPGGISVFSDGFNAAMAMRVSNRKHFDILTKWPVKYEYLHKTLGTYKNSHPTIKLLPDHSDFQYGDLCSIEGIYYSPPFQSHLQPQEYRATRGYESMTFNDYLKAIRIFARLSEDSKAIYQRRLNPGEAVIFDNRRILHSRTAFDASQGTRWLKGAYVDTDGYLALLREFRLLI